MRAIGDILPLTIDRLGLKKKFDAEMIILHWRDIMGQEIAAHAWPAHLTRGTLWIAVNNSVWSHHLSMMKDEIISRINAYLQENLVTEIKFQAGYFNKYQNQENTGSDDMPFMNKIRTIRLDTVEMSKAAEIASTCQDEELRQKVLHLMYKELALKKLKQQHDWKPCVRCGTLCRPEQQYCTACSIQKRHEVRAEIKALLQDAPWFSYQELRNYVDCTASQYESVKTGLIAQAERMLKEGKADRIIVSTLVMLTKGITPDKITDHEINQVLAMSGRKKDVSAPRS